MPCSKHPRALSEQIVKPCTWHMSMLRVGASTFTSNEWAAWSDCARHHDACQDKVCPLWQRYPYTLPLQPSWPETESVLGLCKCRAASSAGQPGLLVPLPLWWRWPRSSASYLCQRSNRLQERDNNKDNNIMYYFHCKNLYYKTARLWSKSKEKFVNTTWLLYTTITPLQDTTVA